MKTTFDQLVKTLLAQQTLSEKTEDKEDEEEEEENTGGGINIDTEDGQGESSR
jgi:hypothetical protein